MLKLNLANLEVIYQALQETQNNIDRLLGYFGFDHVEPTPEKRQWLDIVLNKTTTHFMEVSHVEAFLQSCDQLEMHTLSPKQQSLLIECQVLCQSIKTVSKKILKWVVKAKGELNEALRYISPSDNHEMTLETDINQAYYKTRAMLKEVYNDLALIDAQNMINTAGRQLEVMQGKQLFLDTEYEMDVFMDYGIFQYYKEGKNIVQRYIAGEKSRPFL